MQLDRRPLGRDWNDDWSELTWYALTAPPLREEAAKDAVTSLGVPAACPMHLIQRRVGMRARRKVRETRALVPGYLFCAHPWCGWADVLALREVTGVLGSDGRPVRIRSSQLGRLMRRSLGGGMAAAEHWSALQPVRPGDVAEVLHGPLAGWVVEVKSVRGARATVVSQLFGGCEAEVSLDGLEAA